VFQGTTQHVHHKIILDLFIIHGYDIFDTEVIELMLTSGISQRFKQDHTQSYELPERSHRNISSKRGG
jgi:hypothetical protein